jgi:predicted nucleic-acid-binding protein
MISVDTNVLLRIIVDDEPVQSAIARKLVEENEIFVSLMAIVECEWVLRSAYRLSVSQIADALEALMAAPGIFFELPEMAAWAIARFRGGADLADMVHLVASRDARAFASFDRQLFQRAGPHSPVAVLLLES